MFSYSQSVKVSIHVPVKGTTVVRRRELDIELVSIHVPVKGTTRCHRHGTRRAEVSIHVPVKGRPPVRFRFLPNPNCVVSIHVPVKGTTAWRQIVE